ncbi:hypothetical protein [Pseudoflavonifractor sp. HCP28S3_F10]|uniref:hypothetical protein n=1 Tax=Pseudoflavonifractor sp. HCP28S3_F10 TaxID=3438947 RepID=UPI003F88B3F8
MEIVSGYKLKTGKIGDAVAGAYKKVEDTFVDAFLEKSGDGKGIAGLKTGKAGDAAVSAYKAVEDTVVSGYKRVENAFIDAFLEKNDEQAAREQDPSRDEFCRKEE